MAFLDYFWLFSSVVIGGILAMILGRYREILFKVIIPFTGAYILGITVLHLMPIVFSQGDHEIGLYILFGFFIQIFLEQLSRGIEHGHVHLQHEKQHHSMWISLVIGLGIHAFLEGIPLSIYPELHEQLHHGEHNHNHLLVGVILHKAPAAFALVAILQSMQLSMIVIWLTLLAFAMMSPLGAWMATIITPSKEFIVFTTSIIIGLFLHISTTTIYEADEHGSHHISRQKIMAILTGVGLALLTLH